MQRVRSILVKDEKVINAARISARFGSKFRITGINNGTEARQLSLLLRAGALIAPIQIVEERTIYQLWVCKISNNTRKLVSRVY